MTTFITALLLSLGISLSEVQLQEDAHNKATVIRTGDCIIIVKPGQAESAPIVVIDDITGKTK